MNKVMPAYNVPDSYVTGGMQLAECYVRLGMKAEAKKLLADMWKTAEQYMNWYLNLSQARFAQSVRDCTVQLYTMQSIFNVACDLDQNLADQYAKKLSEILKIYEARGGEY